MTDFAWVIEHGESEVSKPRYFAPQIQEGWSYDHLEALRFARRQDAEVIVEAYAVDDEITIRICEHGWGR